MRIAQSNEPNPNAEYSALDNAFAFFNDRLFDGQLPHVFITLRNHPRSKGYFRTQAFHSRFDSGTATDEISLSPATFHARTDREIASTLVHECCHLWQSRFGHISRRGYHNSEWAMKMIWIGLMPSHTGLPGGRMTGQNMTHFIVEGGRFDIACQELLAGGWRLQWQELSASDEVGLLVGGGSKPSTPKKPTRRKFACAKCGLLAWAKASATLVCGSCSVLMC
jgi:hypothetical protein